MKSFTNAVEDGNIHGLAQLKGRLNAFNTVGRDSTENIYFYSKCRPVFQDRMGLLTNLLTIGK